MLARLDIVRLLNEDVLILSVYVLLLLLLILFLIGILCNTCLIDRLLSQDSCSS